MGRPRKIIASEDYQNRGVHSINVNNYLWQLGSNYCDKHNIPVSNLIEGLLKSFFKYDDKYDLMFKQCNEAASDFLKNIEIELSNERIRSIQDAKVANDRNNLVIEQKIEEQKAAEDKATEEQKKYMEKVWRSLRREIIFNYDLINLQLKEIAAKKSRGDEEDYEADQYQEIRAYLENKKILHSQKDLSYDLFIECFNSIDFAEEVEKPRLLAEKEMADGVEA